MRQAEIKAMYEALEKTHQKATRSKRAAIKFLRELGLIPEKNNNKKINPRPKR
jgi:transposase